ncbi:hypothetical protein [Curtobacterium flaccumfaciens]|uniref:hypothetical protein n=1 Tax=Curtobacterium flaccumfaciens TaxID=2035 RepID=UPI00217EEA91|nr:hypothetical protein [Curtobacterium flaccumfaciens]MCS6556454.1 hypothetical protein [Curtobacterium flaccumfaciens]
MNTHKPNISMAAVVRGVERAFGNRVKVDVDWEREVRGTLLLSSPTFSAALHKTAYAALLDLVGEFDAEARREHLRTLGLVARVSVLAETAHRHGEGRLRAASSTERAAARAFDRVEAGPGSGVRVFALEDSVVLWVLAFLSIGAQELGGFLKERPKLPDSGALAGENRWVSGFRSDRERDLDQLISRPSALGNFLDRISRLARFSTHLDGMEGVANVGGPETECWCSRPEEFMSVLWTDWAFAQWQHFPCNEDEARWLDQLVAAGRPRRDVLCFDGSLQVLSAAGLFDAMLILSTAETSDSNNATWHENEVTQSIYSSFRPLPYKNRNVRWEVIDESSRVPGRRSSHGEIDVLMMTPDLLIDVQAKSARSLDWGKRKSLVLSGAAEQHKRLAATAGAEVRIQPESRDRNSVPQVVSVGPTGRAQVSITVGTEWVEAWSIGGGAPGPIPRILTTLDHVRVVNYFVPALFRPAYWIDRLAQANDRIIFIDEMDYLVKWHGLLTGSHEPIRFINELNTVIASDSDLETYVVLDNMTFDLSVPEISARVEKFRQRLGSRDPVRKNPRLMEVLEALYATDVDSAIALARLAVEPLRAKIEYGLRERVDAGGPSSFGAWTLTHASLSSSQLSDSDSDLVLYRGSLGEWRFHVKHTIASQIRSGSILPRWRASDGREIA